MSLTQTALVGFCILTKIRFFIVVDANKGPYSLLVIYGTLERIQWNDVAPTDKESIHVLILKMPTILVQSGAI